MFFACQEKILDTSLFFQYDTKVRVKKDRFNMEKIVEQGLLYDFYGELLTEHQRQIYEDAVFQDMSLSELAEEHGISRQGIHDLIKRCDKQLKAYEEKLGLLARFSRIKEMVKEIEGQTSQEEVRRLAGQILEEL